MNRIFKIFIFLLIALAISCNSGGERPEMAVAGEKMAAPAQPEQAADIERKLIKQGYVNFETDNMQATRDNVLNAVSRYKGYVSSDREYKSAGRISNTIVVRVPSDNFDDFLADATTGVEKFDNKEINVRDVTEEFLDVSARLKTKKELEARYLELIKQAKNVTEILEIEKQIGILRSEIESIEARLNYLNNQVSMATLNMTFYETIPERIAFGDKFKNGFRNGWDNLVWFFVAVVNIWPFVLLAILLILGIRFYRKKK